MSPLWRDRIRIGLAPDQIALVRLARGWRPQVIDKGIVPCRPDGGEKPWQAPLAALKKALPPFAPRAADVDVTLSNAFVHYSLVPWSDQLSGEEEEIAYVRHCFTKIYGDRTKGWALRLSPEGAGTHRVASAVDQGMLNGLADMLRERGLSLRSVQPYLMAAFNRWRPHFKDRTTWFAMAEGGRLSLALFHQDQWRSLRTVKVNASWPEELPLILNREQLLAGMADVPKEAFLLAPELAEAALPADNGWKFRRLVPPLPPGLPADERSGFAMAWSS